MSTKEDNNGKESEEPDYDEDKDQLEEKQEEETGEINQTTNHIFWPENNVSRYSNIFSKYRYIHIFKRSSIYPSRLLKILSIGDLVDIGNTIPIFKRAQSKKVLLMSDYLDAPSVTAVCNHCKTNLAEIFQERGEFCLHCWQERTCPNV